MIATIVGDVGSGKSYLATKEAIEYHEKGYFVYSNFTIKGLKNWKLIEKSDILNNPLDFENPGCKEFWEKYFNHPCIVIIDEASGWMDSRNSTSKQNKIITRWISQIRKIFGGIENSWLLVITQMCGMIDLRARGLTQYWIQMTKIKKEPNIIFKKTTYKMATGKIWTELIEFDQKIGDSYNSFEIIL